MNDENTNHSKGIVLNLSNRNIDNRLYKPTELISHPLDEEKWYNFIYKRRLLTHSVRDLNKCGIEVDYSNRNKIVHNYE